MTKRNTAIAAWTLILIAELAVYVLKFPRLVADISENPTVFFEAMGATGTAIFVSIVGVTTWLLVLVLPLGKKSGWFWLKVAQTVLAAIFSLGICFAVLIK